MSLTKIDDISPYFEKKGEQWIFTGKKLEIYIPKVYQERDLLTLGDSALCLAIFQLRINESLYANMMMLARIDIEFIDTVVVTENDYQYVVLVLEAGSVFIRNSHLVKNSNIIYEVFTTFLALGKIPPFINYDSIQSLFDKDSIECGVNLPINHSIFEVIYAHMFRDSKDPYKFYRHTRMDQPPQVVNIHQISHGTISTTARIVGSYLNEGMTASLVDDSVHSPSVIENLIRA